MCPTKIILWSIMVVRAISATETLTVHQPDSVITAQLGESVTLKCTFSHDSQQYMFWYKQRPGEMPVMMVMAQTLSNSEFHKELNNSHYSIEKETGIFHLTIKNTTVTDEASYFCGITKFYHNVFGNGTFVALTGNRNHRLDLTAVIETSLPDRVHSSDPKTLECTVLTETTTQDLSVFWFRPTSGVSHPVAIYIQKNCSSEPESGSHSQSCVFKLPVGYISDPRTFYCAVTLYGELLLGDGGGLATKQTGDAAAVGLVITLALSVAGIIFWASLSLKRTQRKDSTGDLSLAQKSLIADQSTQMQLDDLIYTIVLYNIKTIKSRSE